MADIKIKLAGQEFTISPLTIRQCRDLRIGDTTTVQPAQGVGIWTNIYELSIKTIAIAISKNHPEVTEEKLWELETTENEIVEARRQILIHAGFRAPEPTIAELRAMVASMKNELADLEKTLAQREEKAKTTGEG